MTHSIVFWLLEITSQRDLYIITLPVIFPATLPTAAPAPGVAIAVPNLIPLSIAFFKYLVEALVLAFFLSQDTKIVRHAV